MNHSDGERCTCSECGSEFHFTSAEQRFYEEKGLNYPPKRCKACRMARKASPAGGGRGAPRDSGGGGGYGDRPRTFSREGGGGGGGGGYAPRDSGGGGGYAPRDSGGGGGYARDAGGFRGPSGYGGGAPRSDAPRGDDRRGPPAPRFGQGYNQGPPQQSNFRPREGGFDQRPPRAGGFDQRPPRVGGFAPRAPRFGDDRQGFRPRNNFDAPPPAAYGQDRGAPRGRDSGPEGEPRKARVAREKPKFDITCQQCGAHASVPFKPLPGRDIFCPNCYRARKGLSPEERAASSIANASASVVPIEINSSEGDTRASSPSDPNTRVTRTSDPRTSEPRVDEQRREPRHEPVAPAITSTADAADSFSTSSYDGGTPREE